jgi:sulfur-oxidizing protein SoxY
MDRAMIEHHVSRRAALQFGASAFALAALGGRAWAQPAAWERIPAARRIVGDTAPANGKLALELPLLSEDGSSVPLTVRAESPMSAEDHVRSIHLFASRNPSPEIAVFEFTPRAGIAQVGTRVRLNESQTVIAVARTSKDEVYVAERDIRITTSGCLVRADTYKTDQEMAPRVRVPAKFSAGKPTELLTLINHPMETGLREGADGKLLPQRIIRSFEATLDGEAFFKAALFRSLAANPYLRFFVAPTASGNVAFRWTEDTGRMAEQAAAIAVG